MKDVRVDAIMQRVELIAIHIRLFIREHWDNCNGGRQGEIGFWQ